MNLVRRVLHWLLPASCARCGKVWSATPAGGGAAPKPPCPCCGYAGE